ncbi:MAG TPA: hypothetical protein VMD74_01090 [Candidatus Methylomirabilis sp.]|nr:hypothetical protein [Candidatus Methylomirabilis sp.]
MLCVEEGCPGKINLEKPIRLMTSCHGGGNFANAFPCKNCGRLHWPNGEGVMGRDEKRAYLIDGKVTEA